jgi:hypothetical protein
MRWATRQHVLTSRAKQRSVWHRWFAWHPVIIGAEQEEFDHWVWFETLERKWSLGRYGDRKGHWRYRHPAVPAKQPDKIPDGSSIIPED